MKKTLTFEGAGCVPVNDVENCRIRTAFINDQGKAIYLELLSGCRYESHMNKQGREKLCTIDNMISVDFCFYLTGGHNNKTAMNGGDDCNESKVKFEGISVERSRENYGEYTKEGILAFVNKYLHCSFTDIEVTNEFDNYHVHGGDHYNLMEGSAISDSFRGQQ